MKGTHAKTLSSIFRRPISGTIRWSDIEALFIALGAEKEEREGSRVAFVWKDQVYLFHKPHPRPVTDKGAVAGVRRILESNGVKP